VKKGKRKVSDTRAEKKEKKSLVESEQELEQDRPKITRLEYISAPLIALLGGIWAFPYVGTSINWDDLLYMNLSQYTTGQAWVLNRYGHVYLQKVFFFLAGDALTGTRLYWCFLFFSTCVLVYWCARILAGKKGCIIGLIAVLLFCMQPIFAKETGCTLADFTVMFLVMLGTFVYLAFLENGQKHRHLIIMILGLLFFWAVKSKETGICMAVLFLGLGQDGEGSRSIRRFVKDVGWVCLGMLAGSLLLMTLDMAFMGDFWFSVRPSSIKGVLTTNFHTPKLGVSRVHHAITSWYTALSKTPLFAPFLFYLFVGWKSPGRSFSSREKIIWSFPLVTLIFLIFIRICFYVVPRYFALAIPVICIWAAQFFRFKINETPLSTKSIRRIPSALSASALVLAAFLIVCIFMHYMPQIVEYYKLRGPIVDYYRLTGRQAFYWVAIMPSSITVLLIVAAMSRKRGLMALFFSSLCLFFLIYHPLEENLTLLKQRVVAKRSEWRYEPFRAFADELRFGKDVKVLISKDIHERSWMLGRRQRSHCWMFNIFFNQKFDYEQFIDGTRDDILEGNYTYAFLTRRDWNDIRQKHNVDHLLQDYELKADRRIQIILLKKR